MDIIIRQDDETLFSSTEEGEVLTITMEDMTDWDCAEAAIREILEINISGPMTAKLINLVVRRFMMEHTIESNISSAELRAEVHG